MSKEIQVKGENALAAPNEMDEFFQGVTVSKQDLMIPKLLPMQMTSELVAQGKAVMGEFRDSLSGDLKGHIDRPFDVIPFMVMKQWDILKLQPDGKTFKYEKMIPVVDDATSPDYNGNWDPFALIQGEDGITRQRVYRYNFFVLLPEEVEKGGALPYVLSFKKSSIKAGKKLLTEMYTRNAAARKLPFADKFKISGTRQKNADTGGAYVSLDIARSEACNEKELAAAKEWFRNIRGNAGVKIDDSDEIQEAAPIGDINETGGF